MRRESLYVPRDIYRSVSVSKINPQTQVFGLPSNPLPTLPGPRSGHVLVLPALGCLRHLPARISGGCAVALAGAEGGGAAAEAAAAGALRGVSGGADEE